MLLANDATTKKKKKMYLLALAAVHAVPRNNMSWTAKIAHGPVIDRMDLTIKPSACWLL